MKRQLSLITTFAILLTIQSPISAESATPKSVAMNKLQLKNWISSLSSYDFNTIDLISNSSPLSLPTTLAQIDSELAATRLKLSNFSADLTSISDKVDTDNTATAVAKSNVAQFQTSYQSLQSQLNIISGQYSSAMNDRASALSCSILKMFGKIGGPCYPESPSNTYIISQYNILKAQVDAALANWQNAQNQVNSATQTYYSDAETKEVLSSEIDLLDQKVQNLSDASTSQKDYSTKAELYNQGIFKISQDEANLKNQLVQGKQALTQYLKAKDLNSILSAASKIYKKLDTSFKSLKNDAMNLYQPDAPPVFTSEVFWLPSDFGTGFGGITHLGPDYGMKWSKFWACTGQCVVALLVTQANCTNAVVKVSWIDATKTIVGTSSASVNALNVGTIYPFAFTLPNNVDQTKNYSANLAGYECTQSTS